MATNKSKAAITTVGIPKEYLKSSGVVSFVLYDDASGIVYDKNGKEKAQFRTDASPSEGRFFSFEREGGKLIESRYSVAKNKKGQIIVKGVTNGRPFYISVTREGKFIKKLMPKLDTKDKAIFLGMTEGMVARSYFHDQFGCALAGVEVIVSAFCFHPIGIAFGFIGMVAAC